MANDNRLIINDSFEYGYKIVSNNVEGRRVHSIVDRFGNILDFFFDDEPKLIPISYEKCFALGNDKHGKNQFCKLFSSYRDPEKNGCERITSFQEVSGIHKINNDRLLLLTSNGLCFFDTNDLEQASDFFDSLRPAKNDKNGLWIYEKKVTSSDAEYTTSLFGVISLDGSIHPTCYDTFFKKEISVDSYKCGFKPYDIIITDDVIAALDERQKEDQMKATRKVNSLIKSIEKQRTNNK